jgi:hypothetical protein
MKTILHGILLSTLVTTISFADIINVPTDIDSIQGGIDLANDGDTVLVDVGTYYENINFKGKNIVVGSLTLITGETSYISQTVIDGDSIGSVVTFEDSEDSTVVLCGFTITNGVGEDNGWDSYQYEGGGILCTKSNPILKDLLITGNSCDDGGGIYLDNSSPTLVNVTITENDAGRGGGIFATKGGRFGNPESNPKFDPVNRCNIYQNHAQWGSDFYSRNDAIKGVVYIDTFTVYSPTNYFTYPKSSFTFDIKNAKIEQVNNDLYVNPNGNNNNNGLTSEEPLKTISFALMKIMADSLNPHTIFLANGEYTDGSSENYPIGLIDYITISGESRAGVIFDAGIFSFEYTKGVTVQNFTILGDGGDIGIYCVHANPIIKNVTLNKAMIWLMGANPRIEKVKIFGNTDEAGILMYGSSPTLMNVEITDNSSWLAGGLRIEEDSHVNLFNCTISGNGSSYENIGGIHINYESSLNIVNSIIWQNPLYEIGINEGGEFPNVSITVTNSLLKGGTGGIHHIYGGGTVYWLGGNIDTVPMFVETANGDYRLRESSPCIDKGIQDTMIVYNNGQDTLFVPAMSRYGCL